jgi:histidinol-phosphate/aromatic aminotransferase/cobyric acid decarboxylase-like protein
LAERPGANAGADVGANAGANAGADTGWVRAHGGLDPRELERLGLRAEDVLDFSVNVNPYGPAPALRAAVAAAPVDVYPDPRAWAARRALGAWVDAPPEAIAVGNGAAELLWTLARVLLRPGEPTLVLEPTFAEWRAAARAAGAVIVEHRAPEAGGFALDLEGAAALARRVRPRAVYLCNPNNPTGEALPPERVAAFARALEGVPLVLDEAFLSLSERWEAARAALPANVVRVRSLTKEHSLPGLRVGYLMGTPPLVDALDGARPAWTVSAGALRAAELAPAFEGFVAESRERWLDDRRALEGELRALGYAPLPSATTYLVVRVPDAAGDAAALRAQLLGARRIQVRDCASFGMPAYVRLGARPAAERARLIEALRAAGGRRA